MGYPKIFGYVFILEKNTLPSLSSASQQLQFIVSKGLRAMDQICCLAMWTWMINLNYTPMYLKQQPEQADTQGGCPTGLLHVFLIHQDFHSCTCL